MSGNSLSSVIQKIVSDRVWQQLVELWLSMKTKDETQLLDKDILLKVLENNQQEQNASSSAIDNFLLLITPKFNAFLLREEAISFQTYRVSIIFEPKQIIDRLIQLAKQRKWNDTIIEQLTANLTARLTSNSEVASEFVVDIVALLTASVERMDSKRSQYSTEQMDKLLYHQVERERILEQIQIQIGQNLNLASIIQTALDRGCSYLQLDRLLIYQLDVPVNLDRSSFKPVQTVDTIAYEAKKNEQIDSLLYFQEEICWQKSQTGSINKYHKGFSLVVDNVDASFELNSCLKALMNRLQVKAKVVVPINVRGKLWGTIIAHQYQPRQWQHQEVQFLRQIAEHFALAIFNHQSYEQLQQQKRLLEQQVKIQARQLKDALIAAEAASKSKHDFIGSMSHELRTPLTCVIGLSSTLLQWSSAKHRRSLTPEKQQEYLHLIQQSGKHLLTLINNILEFSDVESGKHLLEIEQISLNRVVKESLHLIRESAIAKNIALSSKIEITTEQDPFFADEARLKEILFHLLNNAVKFTPAGGRVTLKVWQENHQVAFQIEDTGIGIAPAQIPLLFEQFKQLEDVRQRTHGGTGLGLALTKKLVELHGGTIEVESFPQKGSSFTVYLPETAPKDLNLSKAIAASQTTSESQTVLLITEDEASATFICQLLDSERYQVVWLADSEMASDQIELLQPKVIIIDRNCSLMNIKNVMNAIASIAPANRPRVALLCDRFEDNEWQKFTDCGIHGYLLKSMNPAQITRELENLIVQDSYNKDISRRYQKMDRSSENY